MRERQQERQGITARQSKLGALAKELARQICRRSGGGTGDERAPRLAGDGEVRAGRVLGVADVDGGGGGVGAGGDLYAVPAAIVAVRRLAPGGPWGGRGDGRARRVVTDGRPLVFDATTISAALRRLRGHREHLAAKRDHYRALADGLGSPHLA